MAHQESESVESLTVGQLIEKLMTYPSDMEVGIAYLNQLERTNGHIGIYDFILRVSEVSDWADKDRIKQILSLSFKSVEI